MYITNENKIMAEDFFSGEAPHLPLCTYDAILNQPIIYKQNKLKKMYCSFIFLARAYNSESNQYKKIDL